MRSLIVIFAVALIGVQALTEEQKEKVKGYHADCLAVSKADPELIKKARNGEFTDDAKLKEHLFCFSKKAGFQNEAGEVQEEVLLKKFAAEIKDEAVAKSLIKKCVVKQATPQETAFETIKCYYANSPTHISIA